MTSDFIHLHTHSHFSLLNALPKIDALIKETKKNNMDAIALTDAGNLYGAIDFYKKCKKEDIKPIIGIDAYLAVRTRFDKEARVDSERTRIILLVKNYDGYKNLMKIVSKSYLEGFYYKPRVDYKLLNEHSKGLIAIIPSFSSETTKSLRIGDEEKAKKIIDWYRDTYGKENVFYEITHHPEIEGHKESQKLVKEFCEKNNIPLVAGQEVYYLYPEDRLPYETMQKIQSGGELEKDTYTSEKKADFSFIDEKTAKEHFQSTPDAIKNTRKIADMCNLELKLGDWIFPNYEIEKGKTYDEILRETTYKKIPEKGLTETKEVTERIEYELNIIKEKGFSPYFLIVADLLNFARENNILSTTRGSAAGSLVSYINGITNIDPLKFELPFERFLNPERPKAPDIDMDFADDRRDEVIQYARDKYGKDKVAQIGTFGTMMARGVVRDVARALGYSYDIGDRIAKLIPFGSQGFPMTIKKALDETPELLTLYKKEKDVKEIMDLAQKIEGCARHISVHAAGVVISPTDITDFAPVQLDPKGEDGKKKLITQYNMHAVEDVGLIKFDFLGIKNLSILADAVRRVRRAHGIDIDIEKIPLDDEKTFQMLARGETMGAFQLGGSGMTRYLKELRPSSIHDINAMIALYRPGPMESIPSYIERKHNPHLVNYLDPRLKDILYMSHGVITYQDDVLLIAINLAGYSWLEADDLRKAMGKKIPEKMKKHKEKLQKGFIKNGMTEQKAQHLWHLIEPFAAYGFNKCLTGDTEIIDSKTGEKRRLEDIFQKKIKLRTYSFNENKKIEPRKIEKVLKNGKKEVFKIKTRSGKEIKATSNHKFYTIKGWKQLKELKEKDRIATVRKIPEHKNLQKIDKYKIATIGYLLSEGNLCHPHGVYFYSSEKDEVNDFIKYASKFSNSKIKINNSKSATSVYIGQEKPKKGNSLMKMLEDLDLKKRLATEKFIPSEFFKISNSDLSLLIGKMWQGDGCMDIKNTQLFYSTSSKRLAQDLQLTLLRLEIFSTIHTKLFKYRGTHKKGYTINISHKDNIKMFAKSVGKSLIGKKKIKFKELYEKTLEYSKVNGIHPARGTKDVIPKEILEVIRKEMFLADHTTKSISKTTKISERMFERDSKKIGYQRKSIEIIGNTLKSQEILNYAQSEIYWEEILEIKPVGKEMTYDLTVGPHHNFIANGFVVHNSHAASYGRVAYETAYMKANYTVEYMTALLSADAGVVEKISESIKECNRLKIPVLPPDINQSFADFTVANVEDEKSIRFGLNSIKNFGEGIANSIINEREENGKFKNLTDFLERIKDKNLNKKSLEALVKAGAMDNFEERGKLLHNTDSLLEYNRQSKNTPEGQNSLFENTEKDNEIKLEEAEALKKEDFLSWEKELLGLYISGHPLDKHKEQIKKIGRTIHDAKTQLKEGMEVVLIGLVETPKTILTKKGEKMMFITLSDYSSKIEAVIFPKIYEKHKNDLEAEKCIAVKSRLSARGDEISLIVENIKKL